MDNKMLKKLSRLELLEILLEQRKRIEDLEQQVEKLNDEVNSKKLSLSEVGTLAEASLKLTNIFKEADEAIAIYKSNIEEQTKKEANKVKKELRELKTTKLAEIDELCKKREEASSKRIKKVEEKNKKISKPKKVTSKKTK